MPQASNNRHAKQREPEACTRLWVVFMVTHIYFAVLLEGGWRWEYCCRLDVKAGTTIIGMLNLILDVFNLLGACLLSERQCVEFESTANIYYSSFIPLALTCGSKLITGILVTIGIIIESPLLYGNFKDISRIMKPALYWWFAWIVFRTVTLIRLMVDSLRVFPHFQLSWFAGPVILLTICWLILLWCLQVVRCRIADIEEKKTGHELAPLKYIQEFDFPKPLH